MNVAVASPRPSLYSETFIRMQMEKLPCGLRIHGGPVASETIPGGPIAPLKSLRGIWETAIDVGLRNKPWHGPQVRELRRRLKARKISAVLANYGPTGVALLPVCRSLRLPLVVHFHGFDAHSHRVIRDLSEAYGTLGREANAVIAVSQRMKKALLDLGFPEDKISIHRCGVDSSRFSEKHDFPSTPTFIGVGRFVDKKAPYLTLLAFQKLLDRVPEARLVLVGDGPLWEATCNLAEGLGIAHAVEFPGVLSPDQIAEKMSTATAFVQHSIVPGSGDLAGDSEGTPVAVLEALMAGLPVIATDHAGIGEVIRDGVTGLLMPERDVEGMADAMIRLGTDTELAHRLGACARRDALLHYTETEYIAGLRGVLENASDPRRIKG